MEFVNSITKHFLNSNFPSNNCMETAGYNSTMMEIVPVSLLYRVNIDHSNWTINEYWLDPDKNEYWLAPPRELYYQQASEERPSFMSMKNEVSQVFINNNTVVDFQQLMTKNTCEIYLATSPSIIVSEKNEDTKYFKSKTQSCNILNNMVLEMSQTKQIRSMYEPIKEMQINSSSSILSSNGPMHFNPGIGKRKETPCSGNTEMIKEKYHSSYSKNNKAANYKYVDRIRHALKDISKHRLNVSQKSKPKESLEEIVSYLKKRNSKHIEKQLKNNVRNLDVGTPNISPKHPKIINFFTTCGQMDVENTPNGTPIPALNIKNKRTDGPQSILSSSHRTCQHMCRICHDHLPTMNSLLTHTKSHSPNVTERFSTAREFYYTKDSQYSDVVVVTPSD